MSVECVMCHQPVRSDTARQRRIGSGCWRKLTAGQRASVLRLTRRGWHLGPREARAALERPVPTGAGQLPIADGGVDAQQR